MFAAVTAGVEFVDGGVEKKLNDGVAVVVVVVVVEICC